MFPLQNCKVHAQCRFFLFQVDTKANNFGFELVLGEGGGTVFTGVKVFSATKAKEREELGDDLTRWLRRNQDVEVVDTVVTQSSDREFHCLTITVFYSELGRD
jgi:hypothetical protein